MSAPAVSVVVPAFNAAATIGRTLEALAAQDLDAGFEVIVVDDGSSDETVAIAERAPLAVSVLRQRNQGPAAARNAGVEAAQGPVIAFTDADCFPAPGWLREGLAAIGHADLVQGLVRPEPGLPRRPFDRIVGVGRAGGLFECANLFVQRDLFERLGGFEDWLGARIGKQLAEDVWFGWRAHRAGAQIGFASAAEVHHAIFRRRLREYVAWRFRAVYFPATVRKIPELRDDFLYRRWFLTPRSAQTTLAVAAAAAALALALAGAGPVALAPLAGAGPYAASVARQALRWRRRAPLVAAGELAADLVTFVALAWGSLRYRCLVL